MPFSWAASPVASWFPSTTEMGILLHSLLLVMLLLLFITPEEDVFLLLLLGVVVVTILLLLLSFLALVLPPLDLRDAELAREVREVMEV